MKVFVAGATGAVGHRAVRHLAEAGHDVTAVARTPAKAALVERLGARPVTVDLFDHDAVATAVAGHDAVVNLATKIPPVSRSTLPGAWDENDRIRREVSANLVDAALATGTAVYLQESIAFAYDDHSDEWIDESAPLGASPYVGAVSEAEANAERFTEAGRRGIVLRFGMFYGARSAHTDAFFNMARAGISPFVGSPSAYMPMVHLDDAARAVVVALDAPAGPYNVVDDEPLTRAEHAEVLARLAGRRRLRPTPKTALRIAGKKVEMLTRSERVSNRRFKETSGWEPRYPSTREGLPAVAAEMGIEPEPQDGFARAVLAGLALLSLQLGVWASLAPRSFYDDFPGGGRVWVAVDGPYNEHFVRDFGALNLALFVVTVVALWRLAPVLVRTAAVAWIAYSTPHLVYHLRHLDIYDTVDAVANVSALGLALLLPIAVLVRSLRSGRTTADPTAAPTSSAPAEAPTGA